MQPQTPVRRSDPTRLWRALGGVAAWLFLPSIVVVSGAALHFAITDGRLGGWAWVYAIAGPLLTVAIGSFALGTRWPALWHAIASIALVPAAVIALQITEWTAPFVGLAALVLFVLAFRYPRARAVRRLDAPPAAANHVSSAAGSVGTAQHSAAPQSTPHVQHGTWAAPGPGTAAPATRFPLIGREQRTTLLIAAIVLGIFVVPPLLTAPVTLAFWPADQLWFFWVLIAMDVVLFGVPWLFVLRLLILPPRDAYVVDDVGVRREGGTFEWSFAWSELAHVGLSIKTRHVLGSVSRRVNRRRQVRLVFTPVADAGDLLAKVQGGDHDGNGSVPASRRSSRSAMARNGLQPWSELPGFSFAAPIIDAPFSGRDPAIVTDLAAALHARSGGRFVGIYRDSM